MPESLLAAALAAVLVSFLLVYLRTRRLEEHLARLQCLVELNQEVRQLRERLAQTDLKPLEEQLRGILESGRACERALRELAEELRPRPGERVRDLIERTFARQGYGEIKIRSDLTSLGEGPQKVHLEVMRDRVAYKGYVVVEKGTVVDSRLLPTYEVFP